MFTFFGIKVDIADSYCQQILRIVDPKNKYCWELLRYAAAEFLNFSYTFNACS